MPSVGGLPSCDPKLLVSVMRIPQNYRLEVKEAATSERLENDAIKQSWLV